MDNCIIINGERIELTEEQLKQIHAATAGKSIRLADAPVGSTVKIGDYELVVLEQFGAETALILKEMYVEASKFGEKNDYNGSLADEKCQEFASKLAEIIGWDNLVLHEVDLTSDDGLKDYGSVARRASLLTTAMYREYVEILDTVNPDCWWWLATAYSTARHTSDRLVKCVSPSGGISYFRYYYDRGVRPFCILKSNIFVSK